MTPAFRRALSRQTVEGFICAAIVLVGFPLLMILFAVAAGWAE